MVSQTLDGQKRKSCAERVRAARVLAARGDLTEAIDRCTETLRVCPAMAEALRLRGHVFLAEGQIAPALSDLQAVLRLRPSRVEALFELGSAYIRAGNLDGALSVIDLCLDLDPDSAPALASRALVLSRQRRYDEALQDITRAAKLRPDNDGDLHNRAVVLTALGRHAEGIRDYEHALEINPASGGTHNNLAWLLAASPDPSVRDGPRAVTHARQALESGEVAAWVDTLAAALAESGDYEEAALAGMRAYRMSQPRNEAFRRRAEVYRQKMSYAQWRSMRSAAKDSRRALVRHGLCPH
jgi:tetratricopeptide (TPR) repeat protein